MGILGISGGMRNTGGVEYDKEVDSDELGETGYIDMKRKFFDVWSDDDDDKEMKKDFLLTNGDWINLGAFLGV